MDINLELYKVFYYVATTLSFSEASRQLFISQSAVEPVHQDPGKKARTTHSLSAAPKKFSLPRKENFCLQHVKPALQMLDEGESLSFR